VKPSFRAHSPKPRAGTATRKQSAEPAPKTAAKPARDNTTPEIGGREGPEPTRYGDWEVKGRCVDF
jgi:hypothetical protein